MPPFITISDVCIFLVTVAICGYIYLSWRLKYFKRMGVKSLPAYPIVGSLGAVVFRKRAFSEHIGYLYNLIGDQRFGGIFEFFKPVVMVKDPELIKLITVKDFDHFVDRHMPLTEESDDMFGKSVFSLEGDRWRHMRAAMSPAFTASKMRAMFILVNECARQLSNFLIRRCREHEAKTNKMLSVEMKDLWSRYTNDVIARAGIGVQVDSLRDPDNEIYAVGKTLTDFGGLQFLVFLGYQFSSKLMQLLHVPVLPWKVTRFLRDLVEQAITVREREDIVRPDLIQLLMKRRGSTDAQSHRKTPRAEDVPPELNNEDIAAQVMVFFLAGFETTSTLLSFMSNRLAVMPDIQKRLREEIDATLARHAGRVTYDSIAEMKYLEMVINETLRMYPPVEVLDRKCVMHYEVPATRRNPRLVLERGDAIWVPVYGLHRDPQYWPEPQRFDPERFSDENKQNITPFTFLPFGSGPRNCIGTRFAMMEVKVAVIHLLTHFELKPVEHTPVELRLSKNTFNITVDGGFWLGIMPRHRKSSTTPTTPNAPAEGS